MGKKSTPSAPAAPDPVATANAQAQANTQAAVTQANLNRVDQYTPQGSLTYQQIGTNSDGTPKYQQTQAYSAAEQQKYDQNNQIAIALNGLAGQNIQRVADAQVKPFSYDGMTPPATGVSAGGVQTVFGAGGPLNTSVSGGPVQSGVNYGAPFDVGSFDASAQAAANASYKQATSRLDPQFQQQQSDLSARLANSGIAVGSDAYNREMDNFSRSRNDAYNQAAYSSQAAGLAAQQQGYSQALGTRQQNVAETNYAGQFANAAQDQRYQQGLTNAQLNNTAQGQIFGQNMQAASFGNTAQNQQFNQNLTNANLQNAARQQQISEATYLRNLPLNEIAALLGTGTQVQNPNFQNVAQVGVAAPDYQGAAYNSYNGQMQAYNTAQANKSSALGSIFGLAGSLGAAAISDRRLKHNIRRIGQLANGLPTYVFSYIGSKVREFGVMAQDALRIAPQAVTIGKDGYMAVDYGKVW